MPRKTDETRPNTKYAPTKAEVDAALVIQTPTLCTPRQQAKIELLVEQLNENPFGQDQFDSMSYDEAAALIVKLTNHVYPPTHAEPTVDIQRQNEQAAQQQNAYIQRSLAVTKVFGQTPAIAAIAPAPDSDYLAKANLIGVTFTCLSVEVHPSNFVQDNPNKPRPNVADYKVVIDQRPDLGVRIVSLGNGLSVNQAMLLAPGEFPFKATLEYGETKGSYNPPFMLASPRTTQQRYFHPAEETAKTVNSPY